MHPTSFASRPRVSWEIRLDNSDLTKVFVSRRVKLTATTTRLNASHSEWQSETWRISDNGRRLGTPINSVIPNTCRDMIHNNGHETPKAQCTQTRLDLGPIARSALRMRLARFSNDPRAILEYRAPVGERYVIRALRLHARHANDADD